MSIAGRLQTPARTGSRPEEGTPVHQQEAGPSEENRKQDEARAEAEQLVVDAEKYRATIEQPQGTVNNKFDLTDFKRFLVEYEDDEFFHLACHVETTLKQKIERGRNSCQRTGFKL